MSITVTNNSDGTFTVSCGSESVIVGTKTSPTTPVSRPPGRVSRPGGFVTTSIVAVPKAPAGAIRARDTKDLLAKIKAHMSSPPTTDAKRKYPGGRQKRQTRELHFSISGKHKIDIGKITALTGGRDAVDTTATHIHIDSDHG